MKEAVHSYISPAALRYSFGLFLGRIKLCRTQNIIQLIKKNRPMEIGGMGIRIFMVIRETNLK